MSRRHGGGGGVGRLLVILVWGIVVFAARPLDARPVVLAPGEPLERAHLEVLFAEVLPAPVRGGRLELRVRRPTLPLANAASVPIRLALEGWDHDPRTGAFRATVRAVAGDGTRSTLVVVGSVEEWLRVPVPRRPVPPGARLRAGDLEAVERPVRTLPDDVLLDPRALEGLEAYRRLLAGRPVRRGEVGPPRLVRRGETVTVTYRRGGLELMLSARALEDGALGQVIRLVNPDSRRSLRARVIGPRAAVIDGGGA